MRKLIVLIFTVLLIFSACAEPFTVQQPWLLEKFSEIDKHFEGASIDFVYASAKITINGSNIFYRIEPEKAANNRKPLNMMKKNSYKGITYYNDVYDICEIIPEGSNHYTEWYIATIIDGYRYSIYSTNEKIITIEQLISIINDTQTEFSVRYHLNDIEHNIELLPYDSDYPKRLFKLVKTEYKEKDGLTYIESIYDDSRDNPNMKVFFANTQSGLLLIKCAGGKDNENKAYEIIDFSFMQQMADYLDLKLKDLPEDYIY